MKIMVFTEGTIFTHSSWLGLPRAEVIRRAREGERPDYAGTLPIGDAAKKIQAWRDAGAEILYLTSRRSSAEVEQAREILRRYGFPAGQLFFRLEGEEYKDAAARALPDILIEDDCESIGGEVEMTYPHIRPEIRANIISIVVREFGGIDHLPVVLPDLVSYRCSIPGEETSRIGR
jgi:hypothetical protein